MKYKKGNIIILIVIGVMAIITLMDLPKEIETIKFLIYDFDWKDEFLYDSVKPEKLILKIFFDILKISILSFGILLIWKWKRYSKSTFILLLIFLLVFLFFDLPIHRCYNGNLETYWELGRHFH